MVASACAITGCFSDRGVAIQVDVAGTGATSVELFLGKSACDPKDRTAGIACTTIAPPDGTVALAGDIWFRDAPDPYTADVAGHTATFQLRADASTTLPIVIAVGTAPAAGGGTQPVGVATLRGLGVPSGGAHVVTATLAPVGQVALPSDSHSATDDRVLVWRTPATSCVVVEHWRSGQVERDFIVPETDPDCDGVPAPECNPAAWHGTSTVGGSAFRPNCFARGSTACVLGSIGCSDDTGDTTTCVAGRDPGQVCVPDMFCGGPCDRYDEACLRMLTASDQIPAISCDVPTLAPVFDLCGNDHAAEISLNPEFMGGTCDQPLISSLAPGFATSASFSGAVMELESPSKPCTFDLQWKSGPRTVADATDYGLIQIPTANGALVIPIVFHFVPNACGLSPFKCTVTGPNDDSLWSCAQ